MGLFGDLFGDDRDAQQAQANAQSQQLQQGYDQATGYMNPYTQAGQQAYNNYSGYLGGMQNTLNGYQDPLSNNPYAQSMMGASPYEYYQNLMQGYNETPQAAYEQEQMMRAANQGASASGMLGSGAYMKALQENTHDITSRDMQQYYQNQLQATQQQQNYHNAYTGDYRNMQNAYLGGQGQLAQMGQNAAMQQAQYAMQNGQGQAAAQGQAAYAQNAPNPATSGLVNAGLGLASGFF